MVQFTTFAGLELVDVMRGHQATKSPDSSTEEGFAITSDINDGSVSAEQVEFDNQVMAWRWEKTPAEIIMSVEHLGERPTWSLMGRLIFECGIDIVMAMEDYYGTGIFTKDFVGRLILCVLERTIQCFDGVEMLRGEGLWSVLEYFESRHRGVLRRIYEGNVR